MTKQLSRLDDLLHEAHAIAAHLEVHEDWEPPSPFDALYLTIALAIIESDIKHALDGIRFLDATHIQLARNSA